MKKEINDIKKLINSENDIITFNTGGTTELGKIVKKSAKGMREECRDLHDIFHFEDGLEFISTTTLEHLFGFMFYGMYPLMHGYKIHPERINYPEDLNIENAVLITTPSFIEAMRKYNAKPEINPKVIITAGAKLNDETFYYAKSISQRVIDIYGSTETGTIAYREDPKEKLKLLNGIEILETGEDYTKVKTNYSVENIVKLGDCIKLLPNREIEFAGRSGRVLKVLEKRFSADEMEKEAEKTDMVKKCYCFEFREKLAAFGILNEKGIDFMIKNDKLALTKLINKRLFKKFGIVPQRWKFFDIVPAKQNGKINRQAIYDLFNTNLSLPLVISRECSKTTAEFELCFLNNSSFFKGHFEGMPILPGVVQLYYVCFFVNQAFNIDCRRGQIRKIKFSNIIRPGETVKLTLVRENNGINFQYKNDTCIYSSGIFPVKNIYEEAE